MKTTSFHGPGFPLQKGDSFSVYLRWEDDWGGAGRDFDLHLVDSTGNEVVKSEDHQRGVKGNGDIPFEKLDYTLEKGGKYSLKVVHRNGSEPNWIQLVVRSSYVSIEHSTGGSINSPSESANPGMLAVGAAWYAGNPIMPSSSRGPTPDGRTKPDIVGATCVRTAPDEDRGSILRHQRGGSARGRPGCARAPEVP